MGGDGGRPTAPRVTPGQTILFLGDHTSPDEPGYVAIVREVLARFHPELGIRLISAGSRGQTAAGLGSSAMMDLLSSARPDWLVIGIGLADALREPVARRLLRTAERAARGDYESPLDATFGPELPSVSTEPVSPQDPALERLDAFSSDLGSAIARLMQSGVSVCLLTIVVQSKSREHPLDPVFAAYNRAIRERAQAAGAVLVDVERAFRDVFDRAANYKQKVELTGPGGELNAQGQALVARSVLAALDLLPSGR